MISSLYLRIAAAILVVAVLIGIGYRLGAAPWQAKYAALQAADWEGRAQAEAMARKALQAQLAQAQATSMNNAQVMHDLQQQSASAQAERDRVAGELRRLLARAAQPAPGSHPVPEGSGHTGAPAASQASSDRRISELAADVVAECRANARQLNALIAELKPQL